MTFLLWHRAARSLSIDTFRTRRREVSYWVAVLFIFTFGTALVDLLTLEWHVGAGIAAVAFLVVIVLVGVLFTRFATAAVLLFWTAYVLTRPLAGALSDWLVDDLGLGAGTATLTAGILALGMVVSVTIAQRRSHQRSR